MDLDIGHVLLGERCHGNVEDVDVRLPDKIQEQVERPLERVEEDLQRIGRNIKVLRKFGERLAAHLRDERTGYRGYEPAGCAGRRGSRQRRWSFHLTGLAHV
jgi:hypothetical protein